MSDYKIVSVDASRAEPWKDGGMADYPIKVDGDDREIWVPYPEGKPPKEGTVLRDREEYEDKYTQKVKLRKSKGGAQPQGTQASRVVAPAGENKSQQPVSKDDYWERKEERDIATQRVIQRQSAQNRAIEFLKLTEEKTASFKRVQEVSDWFENDANGEENPDIPF